MTTTSGVIHIKKSQGDIISPLRPSSFTSVSPEKLGKDLRSSHETTPSSLKSSGEISTNAGSDSSTVPSTPELNMRLSGNPGLVYKLAPPSPTTAPNSPFIGPTSSANSLRISSQSSPINTSQRHQQPTTPVSDFLSTETVNVWRQKLEELQRQLREEEDLKQELIQRAQDVLNSKRQLRSMCIAIQEEKEALQRHIQVLTETDPLLNDKENNYHIIKSTPTTTIFDQNEKIRQVQSKLELDIEKLKNEISHKRNSVVHDPKYHKQIEHEQYSPK